MTVQDELTSPMKNSPGTASDSVHDEEEAPLALLDECPDGGFFELDQWLPAPEQMQDALRLNVADAVDGRMEVRAALGPCPATSMRHGAGMIFLAALAAGLLPFIINWIQSAQLGVAVPLLSWARSLQTQGPFPSDDTVAPLIIDTAQSIVSLQPWLPTWLAAGLSALGQWISWPLQWLTVWIAYGVGVLAVAHLLGAHTTLQRFYAATSYACLPLLLLALAPIPWLGGLIALLALIWSIVIYVRAVVVVTDFDYGRGIISVVTPGAILGLLFLLGIGAGLISALRVALF